MATVGSMLKRPVPAGSAAVSGLIGLIAGAFVATSLTAGLSFSPAAHHSQSAVGVAAVQGELISHNRSEQGLGLASTGGEQIAHNRSEEGLGGQ